MILNIICSALFWLFLLSLSASSLNIASEGGSACPYSNSNRYFYRSSYSNNGNYYYSYPSSYSAYSNGYYSGYSRSDDLSSFLCNVYFSVSRLFDVLLQLDLHGHLATINDWTLSIILIQLIISLDESSLEDQSKDIARFVLLFVLTITISWMSGIGAKPQYLVSLCQTLSHVDIIFLFQLKHHCAVLVNDLFCSSIFLNLT